jgi:hypothetical protein
MKLQTKRYIVTTLIMILITALEVLFQYLVENYEEELKRVALGLGGVIVLGYVWWLIYNGVKEFIK